MKLRKIFKNKLAFSLVELVVVIAIMAILAGAVAGAVVGVRDNANKNQVQTAASEVSKQLQLAIAGEGDAGWLSNTMDAANVVKNLKKVLSGFGVDNANIYTGTLKTPEGDAPYLQVPAKPSAGWLKTTSSVLIYTGKKKVTVTLNGETGLCTIGSITAYS